MQVVIQLMPDCTGHTSGYPLNQDGWLGGLFSLRHLISQGEKAMLSQGKMALMV